MSARYLSASSVPVGEYRSSDEVGVGSLWEIPADKTIPVGPKVYKWVLFEAGADTLALGDAVFYISLDESQVTSDASAATDVAFAGVIPITGYRGGKSYTVTTAPVDAQYGWIQIKGKSDALANDVAGSPSVGDQIGLKSTNDGTVYKITDAAATRQSGIVLVTTASSNIVYLDCIE